MIDDTQNVSVFNDVEYYYNVLISNDTGKSVQLTQDGVKLLVIEDNVFDPFVDGYIIIDNTDNALQRVYKDGDDEIEEKFDFNLAEKDFVYIEIVPKFSPNQKKTDINQEVWNLTFLYVIYDIEDYDTGDVKDNFKKLFLVDAHKYNLMNKTSKFSTALLHKDNAVSEYLRDDSDRSEYTGIVLQNIIKESNPSAKFDTNWSRGFNKVFYTSPINRDYLGDLEYIYSMHQNEVDSDFCILSRKRYTDIWYLDSFQSIVEKCLDQSDKTKAGIELMEAFVIADAADEIKVKRKSRVPTDYGVNYNTSFGDLSKIENFQLIEMSKLDKNDFIKTKIAHTYNFDDGRFEINHFDISDTKKYYDEKYVSKLNSSKSLMDIGLMQVKNKNVQHLYGCKYHADNSYEFLTRNSVLKSQYTLNVGIEFEVTGMTNRQCGKFFSIRKDNNYYDNTFEGKLQGVWYCTNIVHVFTNSGYTNTVSGIKLNLS